MLQDFCRLNQNNRYVRNTSISAKSRDHLFLSLFLVDKEIERGKAYIPTTKERNQVIKTPANDNRQRSYPTSLSGSRRGSKQTKLTRPSK